MTRNMFTHTVTDKNLERSNEIQYNWTGLENFDICFSILFECYCLVLVPARETGHWAIYPTNFETILIIPNFLRFNVLTHLKICETSLY